MANTYFQFKQFTIQQDQCAMKVTTDACLFGAWVARQTIYQKPGHVLDIGTGTGLLSLMLAQQSTAQVDGVEIDPAAVQQGNENIIASPWKGRLFIMPGDAKEMAYTFCRDYDMIMSNPPFYEDELIANTLEKNLARHNSGLLLDELLTIIRDLLKPTGYFYVLLPYKRKQEIEKLLGNKNLIATRIVLVRQSLHHDYFRIMLEGRHDKESSDSLVEEEISIWDEAQQYTKGFIDLLKDYYLKL